jgi:hypothetical protein
MHSLIYLAWISVLNELKDMSDNFNWPEWSRMEKITDVNQEEEDPPIDITLKSTAYLAYLSIIY